MEVLFPEYFQGIPRNMAYFHTTDNLSIYLESDKTMEIGFSDLFLQYFQNIFILWKRPIFSSVLLTDINATVELLSIIKDDSCATVSLPGT